MTLDAEDLTDLSRIRRMCHDGRARAVRVTARVSLTDVAAAAHVPGSTVYRWERGENDPYGPGALRYLAVLDSLAAL